MIWLRYTLLLLIFPAYLIALSRRWWTTIPLWLVSTSVMLTQFMMSAGQSDPIGGGTNQLGIVYVGEMTKIMLIPIAVQFAIILRGMRIGAGRRANHGSQELVEAFDAGER
ncbi:MAG: hypothetical protein ABR957_03025 [Terracidiphilus sp.]|jgi:hypothetical protein